MAAMRTGEPRARKSERVEVRVTPDQKVLFERAAAVSGRTVSEFITSVAYDAAIQTIDVHERMALGVRDTQALVEALLSPPEPVAKARRAAKRHNRLMRP